MNGIVSGPWRPLWIVTVVALWPGLLMRLDGAGGHLLTVAICGLGLIPVAVALSNVVDQLVDRLGGRLGGLIGALLGNLVEFLVGFNALASGLYPLVVISIAGAVVINCLPVLGVGITIACRKRGSVPLDASVQEVSNQQLLLSSILLALPSVFFSRPLSEALQGNSEADPFSLYSNVVAVLALLIYGLGLASSAPAHASDASEQSAAGEAPLSTTLPALGVLTVLAGLLSEQLVDALQTLVQGAHLSSLFVGLFLLPFFGCLPEALVAWKAATRGDINLLMSSTIESSLQLLLFVLPLLVLVGIPLGRHLHLGLPPVALACLAIAMVMIERITANHRLNRFEGFQLIALFVAMALGSLLLINPEIPVL